MSKRAKSVGLVEEREDASVFIEKMILRKIIASLKTELPVKWVFEKLASDDAIENIVKELMTDPDKAQAFAGLLKVEEEDCKFRTFGQLLKETDFDSMSFLYDNLEGLNYFDWFSSNCPDNSGLLKAAIMNCASTAG